MGGSVSGDDAFPRGGGSVLTPLEYREVKQQADAELFKVYWEDLLCGGQDVGVLIRMSLVFFVGGTSGKEAEEVVAAGC